MKKIFINSIISAICFWSCSQEPYDWSQEGPTVIETAETTLPTIETNSIKVETFINVTAGAKISKVEYTLLDQTQTIIEEKEGTPDKDKKGFFTVEFTGLQAYSTYIIQVKAYSSSSSAPLYSDELYVTTASDFTLITGDANSIIQTSAKVYGEFHSEVIEPSAGTLGIVYGINNDLQTGNYDIVPYTSIDGNFFTVELTGLEAAIKYYYCTCFLLDGVKYYGDIREFTTKGYEISNEQVVDLGLSVKWAGYNIGANSPEEYGEYYAWGETETKTNYSIETYKFYNKETNEIQNIGENISGTEYDVAHVKWGNGWRLPTRRECQELLDKCKLIQTTYKGEEGEVVVGPNGNCIFIPTAGHYNNSSLESDKWVGEYMTDTSHDNSQVYLLYLYPHYSYETAFVVNEKYLGFTVRAVTD